MSKHTPGPWMVTKSSDWGGMGGVSLGIDDAAGQDGERDYHLATVVHGDPDELEANARLIAAAPDLLEALRTIVIHASSVQMDPQWAVQIARNAIAKATGEQT